MEMMRYCTRVLVHTVCDSIVILTNHRVYAQTHRFVLIQSEGSQWVESLATHCLGIGKSKGFQ